MCCVHRGVMIAMFSNDWHKCESDFFHQGLECAMRVCKRAYDKAYICAISRPVCGCLCNRSSVPMYVCKLWIGQPWAGGMHSYL